MNKRAKFEELVGKTIKSIDGACVDSERITISCMDGSEYVMHHYQGCCEHVRVADVCGVPADMAGGVVGKAEEKCNADGPPQLGESYTWTFYTIGTDRGWLDIRWLGESNGYYGEDVDFERVREAGA